MQTAQTDMSKDKIFKLRLDDDDRERLDRLALHYSAPAASVVRMLIKREAQQTAPGVPTEASETQDDVIGAIVDTIDDARFRVEQMVLEFQLLVKDDTENLHANRFRALALGVYTHLRTIAQSLHPDAQRRLYEMHYGPRPKPKKTAAKK